MADIVIAQKKGASPLNVGYTNSEHFPEVGKDRANKIRGQLLTPYL